MYTIDGKSGRPASEDLDVVTSQVYCSRPVSRALRTSIAEVAASILQRRHVDECHRDLLTSVGVAARSPAARLSTVAVLEHVHRQAGHGVISRAISGVFKRCPFSGFLHR